MRVRRREVRAVTGSAVLLAGGFAARDMPVGVVAIVVGLVLGFVGSALAFHSAYKANQLWWGIAMVLMPLPAAVLYCAFGMPVDAPSEQREAPREQLDAQTLKQRRREAMIALALWVPVSLFVIVVVVGATGSVAAAQVAALPLGGVGGTINALWVRRKRAAMARQNEF